MQASTKWAIKRIVFMNYLVFKKIMPFQITAFRFPMFTKSVQWTTQKWTRGCFWQFTLDETLWRRHKMQVMDRVKKTKHRRVSNTHSFSLNVLENFSENLNHLGAQLWHRYMTSLSIHNTYIFHAMTDKNVNQLKNFWDFKPQHHQDFLSKLSKP